MGYNVDEKTHPRKHFVFLANRKTWPKPTLKNDLAQRFWLTNGVLPWPTSSIPLLCWQGEKGNRFPLPK
jgi:hypothetical protein